MTRDNFVVHNVNNPSAMTFVKNADRPASKIHFFRKPDRGSVTMDKRPYDIYGTTLWPTM
jgi:hypothetical protein